MKYRNSIIFTEFMMRAVLAGRMTQTRRVARLQPGSLWKGAPQACPYGKPGDRLWVKEAWGYHGCSTLRYEHKAFIKYLADGTKTEIAFPSFELMHRSVPKQKLVYPSDYDEIEDDDERRQIRNNLIDYWWARQEKLPPNSMKRWASRVTLELVDVKLERLQHITDDGALAEGVPHNGCLVDHTGLTHGSVVDYYRHLWKSETTSCGHRWDDNPWVWVLTFKRFELPSMPRKSKERDAYRV